MRKALFRKDLWKDVGPKGDKTEDGEEAPPEEAPTLHQHHYNYTRRVIGVGTLQIIGGSFLYFISIFLPMFGARGYYTEYLVPMGTAAGPSTVFTGIFGRETSRKRKKWVIIINMIMCVVNAVANFVEFIGACAAFGYEDQGWAEDLITEPVIATFRYISYMFIMNLNIGLIFLAVFTVVLDCRYLDRRIKQLCMCDWMPEKGDNNPVTEDEIPITTV